MSLIGKVISIEEGWANVEVISQRDCGGCTACKGLLIANASHPKIVRALCINITPKPGDRVSVDTNPGESSISAFLVFGLPLLGFLFGVFAAPLVSTKLGIQQTELFGLILGTFGMLFSGILLHILLRMGFFNHLCLKIIEILPPETDLNDNCSCCSFESKYND